METSWLWILFAIFLIACCALPMLFMGRHGKHNGRGEKITDKKVDMHH